MFARRFRAFLKMRDQSAILKLSSRDYVGPNLKFSPLAPGKPVELISSRMSGLENAKSASKMSYAQFTQASNDEELEESDEDDEGLGRVHMTENRRAYQVLENNDRYKKTIIRPIVPDETFSQQQIETILAKHWSSSSAVSDLIENFRILSYDARTNRKKFNDSHTNILEALAAVSKDLLNDQIWLLLRYLEMWHPMSRRMRVEALKHLEDALDHQCYQRGLDWDADELLMTCDLMYHLRKSRESRFVSYALKKLGLKPNKMSADNYIHYMFLLSYARRPAINIYELEYRLEAIVEEFNAEELSIIAMGFFKSETPIRNPLLIAKIIHHCVDNMAVLDEIFIGAVMKIARLSVHLRDRKILRSLLRAFSRRINDVSVMCLVQATQNGATTLVYEEAVVDAIMNKLVETGLASARLKDLERLLFSLMVFNYPKEFPLYEMVIEELRNPIRKNEHTKFATSYACSMMYLALAGIYPLDIIERIMAPEYLRKAYHNNAFKLGRQYLILQCGLQIEVPDYKGPFLPTHIYNFLAKKHASGVVWRENPTSKTHTYTKFLAEVMHYLKDIVGEENIYMDQVLPQHHRGDIQLCLNSDDKFIPPEAMLAECPTFQVKAAPGREKNYRWLTLVLLTHNHLFRSSNIISGTINAKLRHLEILGYTPVPIQLVAWNKLTNKEDYLRQLVSTYTASSNKQIKQS